MTSRCRVNALRVAAGVLALASACQGYQLTPVQPATVEATIQIVPVTGTRKSPNVVIVQDQSGSMVEPADCNDATTNCLSCCTYDGSETGGYCPPSSGGNCANSCKWNDVLNAFAGPNGFLSQDAGPVQLGFVAFPSNASCGSPGNLDIPIGPNTAGQIISKLNSLSPGGGTPTAATLEMVGSTPGFVEAGRDSYVILITDGEPNCDGLQWPLCQQCQADAGSCSCPINADGASDCCNPTASGNQCGFSPATTQCLDGAATVAAIAKLLQGGIKTFVIGFGAGAQAGFGAPVLSAMANAGGEAGKCGGNVPYCQANNGAGLQNILNALRQTFQTCTFTLNGPFDPATLVVQLVSCGFAGGTCSGTTCTLTAGADYTLSGNEVTLSDSVCAALQSPADPNCAIQFGYAQRL